MSKDQKPGGSMRGRKLSGPQAASRAGIKPATWRHYVHRGLAPAPDGREEVSGHPWWWEATVDRWMASRPGRGARTDLRRQS